MSSFVHLIKISAHRSIKIAHISTHVGGGVGSVIRDLFVHASALIENRLFCLDQCASNFEDFPCTQIAVDGLAHASSVYWKEALANVDIVLLHYWNHPLMARFLATITLPPCRLLVWSHNSGLYEPHIIPNYLARMAQRLLFTSRCSLKAPNIATLAKLRDHNIWVVHSTRDLYKLEQIGRQRIHRKVAHNLLYVGTVASAKMHQNAAHIFAKLSRCGFNVHVVGGPNHATLAAEVAVLGGHVAVYGEVRNVTDFYRNADIFIYPLRPDHYGTGEQVMLEAMATGLPVIAFDNPAERVILEDGGGLLVASADKFIESVQELSGDFARLQAMSRHALSRIQNDFSAKEMAERIIQHCREILDSAKVSLPTAIPYSDPDALALYALNSFFDAAIYESAAQNPLLSVATIFSRIRPQLQEQHNASRWLGASKSTPFHYLRYFPSSSGLKLLTDKILAACSQW